MFRGYASFRECTPTKNEGPIDLDQCTRARVDQLLILGMMIPSLVDRKPYYQVPTTRNQWEFGQKAHMIAKRRSNNKNHKELHSASLNSKPRLPGKSQEHQAQNSSAGPIQSFLDVPSQEFRIKGSYIRG